MSSFLRLVLLFSVVAGSLAASMYDPTDELRDALDEETKSQRELDAVDPSPNALDAVEAALAQLQSNPRLTAAQLKAAKTVSANVDGIVEELQSKAGRLLSKQIKAAKVANAINQLQGLQDSWEQLATQTVSDKKADLQKQLAEKEGELATEQKRLKVINLERALAEKKLALEKLVEMKNAKAHVASQQETKKQAAAKQEMVANVLNAAKSLQSAQDKIPSTAHAVAQVAGGKASMLKTILVHLEGRMHNVTDALDKLDAAEKKREAELQGAAVPKTSVNGDADAIGKGDSLFKMLAKKAHRQFEKAKAPLKSELKELTESVRAIKKGDIKSLTKVMSHMQGELKTQEAKSGNFLY